MAFQGPQETFAESLVVTHYGSLTPAPLFCPLYRFDLLVLPRHSTSSPSSSATMLHVKSEMGFGAQSAEKHASSSVTASASMVVVQKKLQYSGESSKSEYQVSLL